MATVVEPIEDPSLAAYPQRWPALIVLLIAGFMDLLDTTIVNVALPSIQSNLHASYASVQWVLAAYLLGFAVVLVPAGRAGDVLGRRRMFLVGMLGFTIASLLSGLAVDPAMLIASRALQGLMAAIMTPQLTSFIQVLFPPGERGAAIGAYGGIAGIATVAGPLLGGVLVNANIAGSDWRPIFLINIPVGIGAVIAGRILLPESKSVQPLRLDWKGTALVTAGLMLLLYPLVEGRQLGWPAWSWICMALSPVVLGVAAVFQVKASANGESTLIVPRLFRQRGFASSLIVVTALMTALDGFFLVFTLHLQVGLGYSALRTGLTSIAFSITTSAAAATAATQLAPKFGRNVVTVGASIMLLGVLGVLLTIHVAGADVTPWKLIPGMAISGLGFGCVIAPLFDIGLAEVPLDDAGAASGVLGAMQQLGGAIGVAIIGVVFFGALSPAIDRDGKREGAQLARQQLPAVVVDGFVTCAHDRSAQKDPSVTPASCTINKQVPESITKQLNSAGRTVQSSAFGSAFQRGLIVILIALALVIAASFGMPRRMSETPVIH